MELKPAISVVIPAFNEEKYLPSCLLAFKKQKFSDFEVIVVDNNSTDDTVQIALKYGARVIKERIQGTAAARERGFREIKADIIARTDADTIVTPNWLEIISQTFNKYPQVVGITGPWLSPHPKIPDKIMGTFSYTLSVRLGKLVSGHPYLMGPNLAIRKSAWKKIKANIDDSKILEDIDLSCQLAKIGQIMWQPRLKIIFSIRRIEEDPVKGLTKYLGHYPLRYIKTLSLNDKRLKLINRKRARLKKYLLTKVFNSK